MAMVRDAQEASAIVVYGGTTNVKGESTGSSKMYYYSLMESRWFPVQVEPPGDVPPGRRSFFMTTDLETSLTTIMGGISTLGALTDRWEFESSSQSQENKSVTVAFTRLNSTIAAVSQHVTAGVGKWPPRATATATSYVVGPFHPRSHPEITPRVINMTRTQERIFR